MPDSIRARLRGLNSGQCGNAGLLLSRYLDNIGDDNGAAKIELYKEMQYLSAPDGYRAAFNRWKETMNSQPETTLFEVELVSSLAIGLGNESVMEVGLTLHHTYGMPVIPGSTLKGLCRRGAGLLRDRGQLSEEAFAVLFGSSQMGQESASYCVFWDAWYDPASVGGQPFLRDTITVHHPDYYGNRDGAFPTDFDDPIPVPFLVIKPAAKFVFAVSDSDTRWAAYARELLGWSITNLGVGGKTNAGYGYFQAPEPPPPPPIRWEGVTLFFNPGNGELSVSFNGQRATVSGANSVTIRGQLSEEKRENLRRQRSLAGVTVLVEKIGNGFLIVGVELTS